MKDNWQVAWPCVIGANLIVPLMWALPITSPGGRLGMAFGIALVWLLGHLAFARFTQLRHTILIGGGLVGLTQLLPFLHLFAGGLAFVFLQGFGCWKIPSRIA